MVEPVELKSNQGLYIFPLSDLHYGNRFCNKEFFDVWLEVFRNCKGEKVVYLLGDILETPTSRFSAYDSDMSTNDAIDEVVGLLKPVRDFIRYSTAGNHELRTTKEFNMDVAREVASRLKVPYSADDFFDRLLINGREFIVYGRHGVRTSRSSDLAMRGFKGDVSNIDCDLALQGHNHLLKFDSEFRRDIDKGRRRYYAFTGHYLIYQKSYANVKQYPIHPAGFQRIRVDSDLNCNTNLYYSDELMKHQKEI